jgi:hypothetical protein
MMKRRPDLVLWGLLFALFAFFIPRFFVTVATAGQIMVRPSVPDWRKWKCEKVEFRLDLLTIVHRNCYEPGDKARRHQRFKARFVWQKDPYMIAFGHDARADYPFEENYFALRDQNGKWHFSDPGASRYTVHCNLHERVCVVALYRSDDLTVKTEISFVIPESFDTVPHVPKSPREEEPIPWPWERTKHATFFSGQSRRY